MSRLFFKELLAQASWSLGLLQGLSRWRFRDRAFVLMYHRILPSRDLSSSYVQPGMYVSPDSFREQISFLRETFDVLPLAELMDRIELGQPVGGCCAVTFDDGWQDNYKYAFPILKEHKVPATVFLATGFIGTNRLFWPEEFCELLGQTAEGSRRSCPPSLSRFLETLAVPLGAAGFFDCAIEALKKYSPQQRELLLRDLRAANPEYCHRRVLLNWEEVQEMQASGLISFGGHTVNHEILDQLPLQQAEQEILRSRDEIEERLGVGAGLFAYPNGDFNRGLQEILRMNGFKAAVTTRKGWVGHYSGVMEIPRIGIHEDVSRTIPLFIARVLLERF